MAKNDVTITALEVKRRLKTEIYEANKEQFDYIFINLKQNVIISKDDLND